ncbi:MAG: hypothetical protein RI947_201 [Candidatus Parcubacteria bacterium]|jgi:DNA-binding protein YbaB
MFNPLGAGGDAMKLMKQAQDLQKALQQEEITVEKNGVTVIVRGDQQILEVTVDGVIENRIADAINAAIKKTQEVAAGKLKDIMAKSG